jgi:hypothetical protein
MTSGGADRDSPAGIIALWADPSKQAQMSASSLRHLSVEKQGASASQQSHNILPSFIGFTRYHCCPLSVNLFPSYTDSQEFKSTLIVWSRRFFIYIYHFCITFAMILHSPIYKRTVQQGTSGSLP